MTCDFDFLFAGNLTRFIVLFVSYAISIFVFCFSSSLITDCQLIISSDDSVIISDEGKIQTVSFNKLDGGMTKLFLLSKISILGTLTLTSLGLH